VVETDVHYPTKASLLWDVMRCLVRDTDRMVKATDIKDSWLWCTLAMKVSRARPEQVEDYLRQSHCPVMGRNGHSQSNPESYSKKG